MKQYQAYHESKIHGKENFYFDIYPCTIPGDFAQIPLHWHEEMELIVVKKGRGIIAIDMEEYQVAEGDIVFLLPDQIHSITQKQDEIMEYENIMFRLSVLMSGNQEYCTRKFIQPFLDADTLREPVIKHTHKRAGVYKKSIEKLDEVCREKIYGYQLVVKSILLELVFSLIQHNDLLNAPKENRLKENIKNLLHYLEDHYGEKITVGDAAQICYYSDSHFMKYFKEYMGVTFVDYLNQFRLIKASELLIGTNQSVTGIAQSCGFDNISYFNRLFRKRFSMTPKEYRVKNW